MRLSSRNAIKINKVNNWIKAYKEHKYKQIIAKLYVMCFYHNILIKMEYVGKKVEYYGIRVITKVSTAKEQNIAPFDDTILVQLNNNDRFWFKLSWMELIK